MASLAGEPMIGAGGVSAHSDGTNPRAFRIIERESAAEHIYATDQFPDHAVPREPAERPNALAVLALCAATVLNYSARRGPLRHLRIPRNGAKPIDPQHTPPCMLSYLVFA